jgi:hypothetical protein
MFQEGSETKMQPSTIRKQCRPWIAWSLSPPNALLLKKKKKKRLPFIFNDESTGPCLWRLRHTCQHDARLTRYYNNMRYSGLLLFFFVFLPLLHDTRISSGL